MKKLLPILICGLIVVTQLAGQSPKKYVMIGGGFGTLSYSGDITTDITAESLFGELCGNGVLSVKLNLNKNVRLGLDGSMGSLFADDANHQKFNDRGLQFSCKLYQTNLYLEYTLFRFLNARGDNGNGVIDDMKLMSLYLKGGGGMINWSPDVEISNPETVTAVNVYNGDYTGVNFLFGGGITYKLSKRSMLLADLSIHGTSTDIIDGFSYPNQEGFNDFYGGVSLRYYYSILR